MANKGKNTQVKRTSPRKSRKIYNGELRCPKCGKKDVYTYKTYPEPLPEEDEEAYIVKHHGFMWWLLYGWWASIIGFILVVATSIPRVIVRKSKARRREDLLENKAEIICMCNSCKFSWKV